MRNVVVNVVPAVVRVVLVFGVVSAVVAEVMITVTRVVLVPMFPVLVVLADIAVMASFVRWLGVRTVSALPDLPTEALGDSVGNNKLVAVGYTSLLPAFDAATSLLGDWRHVGAESAKGLSVGSTIS